MHACVLFAALVLNEILYDPAGSDAGHEFVELMQDSTSAVWSELSLQVGDGARPGSWRTVWQTNDLTMQAGEFLVVGGAEVPEARERLTGALQNGPDAVRLMHGDVELDRVGYGDLTDASLFEASPAADVTAQSLARIPDGRDTQNNAADLQGRDPSPGRRNVPRRQWSVSLRQPEWQRFWPQRRVHVQAVLVNLGSQASTAEDWLAVARWMPLREEDHQALVQQERDLPLELPTPGLAPGDSLILDIAWVGEAGPFQLEVLLRGADEWLADNRAVLRGRVGSGPVVLNEILYAPVSGAAEWVELWNRSDRTLSLQGWTLQDASGRRAALHAARALEPGGFALLQEEDTPLAGAAPQALMVSARPWPSLNNTDDARGIADVLTLRDADGLVQDAVFYSGKQTVTGRSLERVSPDADVRGVLWSLCKAPEAATPGRVNSVSGTALPSGRIQLAPNPFSPDGDGIDEVLHIQLQVPDGAQGFRIRLFDVQGRLRRDLVGDRLGPGPRRLTWEGRDDSGDPVELGVYILHFELIGQSGRGQTLLRSVGVVRP